MIKYIVEQKLTRHRAVHHDAAHTLPRLQLEVLAAADAEVLRGARRSVRRAGGGNGRRGGVRGPPRKRAVEPISQ